jgi:hypothetical protein
VLGLCQIVGFCVVAFECWEIVGEDENSVSRLFVVLLVLSVGRLFVRLRILCQGYVLCCIVLILGVGRCL